MEHNKINLLKGYGRYTKDEWKRFHKGDTVMTEEPEILKVYDISEKEKARIDLKAYRCSYEKSGQLYDVEEYALEYFTADEDGEFVEGSDFDLAESRLDDFCDLLMKYEVDHNFISERFDIPNRTVQNWKYGKAECPSYIIKMMDEILSK